MPERKAATDLALEINLDDFDDLDQRDGDAKLDDVDNDLNTFDDFANDLNIAIDNKENMSKDKKENLTIDIKHSNYKELGDIFEKIDEFDSMFGTVSPKFKDQDAYQSGQQPAQSSQPDRPAVPVNRNSLLNKSEIVVQMNKLVIGGEADDQDENTARENEDPFADSPQSDKLPEDDDIEDMFNLASNQ